MKTFLIHWLARRLPDCDATTKLMEVAMDEKISPWQRIQVRLHLWVCVYCARYKDQILTLRKVVRHRSAAQPKDSSHSSALSSDARERMKRRLAGE